MIVVRSVARYLCVVLRSAAAAAAAAAEEEEEEEEERRTKIKEGRGEDLLDIGALGFSESGEPRGPPNTLHNCSETRSETGGFRGRDDATGIQMNTRILLLLLLLLLPSS